MKAVVADTHAFIWYLTNPGRLSQPVLQALDEAIAAAQPIHVSAISLVELRYLLEKGKVTQAAFDLIMLAITATPSALAIVPVDLTTAAFIGQVPRAAVPDMPDRIIAATAVSLGVSIVSRDRKIQVSGVPTIW